MSDAWANVIKIGLISGACVAFLWLVRVIVRDVRTFMRLKGDVKQQLEKRKQDLQNQIDASTEEIARMSDQELADRFNQNKKEAEGDPK